MCSSDLALPNLTAGLIADLDGDADLDIVAGGDTGLVLVHSNVSTTRQASFAYVRVQASRSTTGHAPVDAVGIVAYVTYASPAATRAIPMPAAGPLVISYPVAGRASINLEWIDKQIGPGNFTSLVAANQAPQPANRAPLIALAPE